MPVSWLIIAISIAAVFSSTSFSLMMPEETVFRLLREAVAGPLPETGAQTPGRRAPVLPLRIAPLLPEGLR